MVTFYNGSIQLDT